MLLVLVFAMTDKKNMAPPQGLAPLFLFLLVLGIGAVLGMETGAVNLPSNVFLHMELIVILRQATR